MRRIQLWGHRGARALFPENTVEGIRAALGLGLDGVEIDVALTADGVPVLSHDPALHGDLARGPDGKWLDGPGPLLKHLRADEVARFDVGRSRPGGPMAVQFPAQSPRDGARVPRLDAALAIGGRCLIELKTFADRPDETATAAEMAEAVALAVDRAGASGRVIVESFDWRGPRHLRHSRPNLPLAWLTRAETERAARLWWDGPAPQDFGGSVPRAVSAEGGGAWAPDYTTVCRDQIEEAHALGLSVMTWTVNDPADITRLIDWGVDGIITDHPGVARRVMAAKGLDLPPLIPHRAP